MPGIDALRNNYGYAKPPCGRKRQHIGAFHETDYQVGLRYAYRAPEGTQPCHLPKSSQQRIGGRFTSKSQIAELDGCVKLIGRNVCPL